MLFVIADIIRRNIVFRQFLRYKQKREDGNSAVEGMWIFTCCFPYCCQRMFIPSQTISGHYQNIPRSFQNQFLAKNSFRMHDFGRFDSAFARMVNSKRKKIFTMQRPFPINSFGICHKLYWFSVEQKSLFFSGQLAHLHYFVKLILHFDDVFFQGSGITLKSSQAVGLQQQEYTFVLKEVKMKSVTILFSYQKLCFAFHDGVSSLVTCPSSHLSKMTSRGLKIVGETYSLLLYRHQCVSRVLKPDKSRRKT